MAMFDEQRAIYCRDCFATRPDHECPSVLPLIVACPQDYYQMFMPNFHAKHVWGLVEGQNGVSPHNQNKNYHIPTMMVGAAMIYPQHVGDIRWYSMQRLHDIPMKYILVMASSDFKKYFRGISENVQKSRDFMIGYDRYFQGNSQNTWRFWDFMTCPSFQAISCIPTSNREHGPSAAPWAGLQPSFACPVPAA